MLTMRLLSRVATRPSAGVMRPTMLSAPASLRKLHVTTHAAEVRVQQLEQALIDLGGEGDSGAEPDSQSDDSGLQN